MGDGQLRLSSQTGQKTRKHTRTLVSICEGQVEQVRIGTSTQSGRPTQNAEDGREKVAQPRLFGTPFALSYFNLR